MTVRRITTLRNRARRTLGYWRRREADSGEAMHSVERAYSAGYVDALEEVLAMLGQSSQRGRATR